MNAEASWIQLDIPPDQRQPLLRRLAIVWAVAFFISIGTHIQLPSGSSYDVALVYSYAISTWIWFFTDVSRFIFRVPLKAHAPIYWPPALQAGGMMLVGIPLGYTLGTLVGDAYAGHSTWELWALNRQRFAGTLLFSLAISIAFLAYFYQRSRAEHQEHQATEAQLLLLQSQLEPHMLFNTLANLRALISLDPAAAQVMLDHLDNFLRATLSASRTGSTGHRLENEFARLEDYLALMAVRMGSRLRFTLDLPEDLKGVSVPPLILQPLVENSIRHGLEPKIEGGQIAVSARRIGASLVLEVTDSGLGYHADQARPEGFGLSQIRQRLTALHGLRASLEIGPLAIAPDMATGTRATVTLPWISTPPSPEQ